ncbi:MAG TPA: sugar ABC transporter permease [Aggregatilineales bacterium]|nr:sugar ABC transporter permease [Anaerolineales bacterium]HRE48434.1 sugar ABC transporter permease [Aggregatilineales bacterium]
MFAPLRGFIQDVLRILFLPILALVYAVDWLITRLERRISAKRMPYFFLLPNLAIFGIFILLPMMLNFAYGFTKGESIRFDQRPAAGLENFNRLFTCENVTIATTCQEEFFWRALRTSIVYTGFEVPLMIFCALAIAVALNREIIFRGMFRAIFFYPVLLSPVVVGIIWKWVLEKDKGLLNNLIITLGGRAVDFKISSEWSFLWVVVVSVWAMVGFYMLILLAGLQSIPPTLYEAARMDGANEWQQFTGVTLPMLRPTLLVVFVLAMIRSVQVFDMIYVLTGGGPGTATTTMVQYIYNLFSKFNYGLAAAASLILAIILAVLTLIQLFLNRRQTEAI